jgi:paraquat-inducible protein B
VKFRGVTIGSVKDVSIRLNQAPADSALPVLIEINEDQWNEKLDSTSKGTSEARMKEFIQRGLRGRLESQSLLTGLLFINMEILPETEATYHQLKPVYPEIPTAPNQFQVFLSDFAAIAQKMNAVLAKLDVSLAELQTKELSRGLTNLLASLNHLVSSGEVTNTLVAAHQTLDELHLLSKDLRSRLDKLTAAADRTLVESRETLGEVREGFQDIRDVIAPRGALRRELSTALADLSEAARSVAALADFLNRHPNALLSGRSSSEPKR